MIAHYTISQVSVGIYKPLTGRYILSKMNSSEVKRIDMTDGSERIIPLSQIHSVFVRPIYPLRRQ